MKQWQSQPLRNMSFTTTEEADPPEQAHSIYQQLQQTHHTLIIPSVDLGGKQRPTLPKINESKVTTPRLKYMGARNDKASPLP